jgi:hypothetical protein
MRETPIGVQFDNWYRVTSRAGVSRRIWYARRQIHRIRLRSTASMGEGRSSEPGTQRARYARFHNRAGI